MTGPLHVWTVDNRQVSLFLEDDGSIEVHHGACGAAPILRPIDVVQVVKAIDRVLEEGPSGQTVELSGSTGRAHVYGSGRDGPVKFHLKRRECRFRLDRDGCAALRQKLIDLRRSDVVRRVMES